MTTTNDRKDLDEILFSLEWKATFEKMTQQDRHDYKAALNQWAKDRFLEIIGEDGKPDVQLGTNSYIYSGELRAKNELKAELRQVVEARFK